MPAADGFGGRGDAGHDRHGRGLDMGAGQGLGCPGGLTVPPRASSCDFVFSSKGSACAA